MTDIINTFYIAFRRSDYEIMQTCYHEQATFTDPVFGTLDARHVKAMWEMLLTRSADFDMSYTIQEQSEDRAIVNWIAEYTFSTTKRKVINHVQSTILLKDGKIYQQNDVFDFWKWTRMAMGNSGLLLGWTSLVQDRIKAEALKGLEYYMQVKGL